MPFQKGHTKIGGRKKGTPNQITLETRNLLQKVFSNLLDDVSGYLPSLPINQKIDLMIKIAPYILPKYKLQKHEIQLTSVEELLVLSGHELRQRKEQILSEYPDLQDQ